MTIMEFLIIVYRQIMRLKTLSLGIFCCIAIAAGWATAGDKSCESGLLSVSVQGKNTQLAVAVIENRFIAHGTIADIKRASKGIQKFTLQITKIDPFKDYPSFGSKYLNKTVEIYSEIGIPSSFQTGIEVSVLLQVARDERGTSLFFVEVLNNDSKKDAEHNISL